MTDAAKTTDNYLRQLAVAGIISERIHEALEALAEEGMVTMIGDSVIVNVPEPKHDYDAEEGQTTIFGNHANRMAPIIEQYKEFFKCEFDHEALEMLVADIRSLAHDQALSFNTILTHASAKFKERQDHAPDQTS